MTALRPSCRLSTVFMGALLAAAMFTLATIAQLLQNIKLALRGQARK
jgi:hypothetical protein